MSVRAFVVPHLALIAVLRQQRRLPLPLPVHEFLDGRFFGSRRPQRFVLLYVAREVLFILHLVPRGGPLPRPSQEIVPFLFFRRNRDVGMPWLHVPEVRRPTGCRNVVLICEASNRVSEFMDDEVPCRRAVDRHDSRSAEVRAAAATSRTA